MNNILSADIFITLLSVFYFFYRRTHRNDKGFYDRVERDGGSILFSKKFMNFGIWILRPIADVLLFLKLTPNNVTFLSIVFAMIAAITLAFGQFLPAFLLFTFSSLLDALDGMMSRKLGTSSAAGAIFDSIADRISEMVIFFALIYFFKDNIIAMIGVFSSLMGSILVSYISAKGEIYKIKDLPRGIMRRGERALYINLALLLSTLFPTNFYILICTVWAIGILSLSSSFNRGKFLYLKLKELQL